MCARALTPHPGDVQRVAQKYIQPGRFAVVVVGDRKVIEPGREPNGPQAPKRTRLGTTSKAASKLMILATACSCMIAT